MRILTLLLLMLFTSITPSLACDGLCPMEAQQQTATPPCPSHNATPTEKPTCDSTMLIADCTSLSFNVVDTAATSQEISKTLLPQPDFMAVIGEQELQNKAIAPRAPPVFIATHTTTSPIYLKTLRIRL